MGRRRKAEPRKAVRGRSNDDLARDMVIWQRLTSKVFRLGGVLGAACVSSISGEVIILARLCARASVLRSKALLPSSSYCYHCFTKMDRNRPSFTPNDPLRSATGPGELHIWESRHAPAIYCSAWILIIAPRLQWRSATFQPKKTTIRFYTQTSYFTVALICMQEACTSASLMPAAKPCCIRTARLTPKPSTKPLPPTARGSSWAASDRHGGVMDGTRLRVIVHLSPGRHQGHVPHTV
jgi:hypothetical protein